MAAVAQLKALLGIDTAQAEKAVDNIGNKVKQLGSNQLAGLKSAIAGAFSVGALVMFGRKLLQTADDLQTAASVYGTTIETMIAFKSVMAETGIGAERFNKIFGRIKTMQADVGAGLATYTRELEKMNLTQEDMIGLNAPDVLLLLAKAYGEAADKNKFLEGTSKLLGTRLVELVEVFQRINKEGMEKFQKEAAKSAEGMAKLAAASDSMEKAGNKITLWAAQVVTPLMKVAETLDKVLKIAYELSPMGIIGRVIASVSAVGFKETGRQMLAGEFAKDLAQTVKGKAGEIPGIWEEKPKAKEDPVLKELLRKTALEEFAAEKRKQQAAENEKIFKQEEAHREKLIGLMEQQDKLAEDYEEKAKDIQAGKGISVEPSRVDQLQRVGGIIGGVAGAGSQESRIAERTAKMTEEMTKLQTETNRRLQEIENKIFELGQE